VTESIPFTDLVLYGALANIVLGVVTLAAVRLLTHERLTSYALVAVGAVTGVFAMAQAVVVDDGFGKIHVLYLWVFVTLPVLGAVLLLVGLVPALRPTRSAMVGSGGLLALGALGIYGTHVEPYWIRTDRVSLDVAAVDGEPLRIGVMSDLQPDHISDYERDAVRRLMREEPDMILIAGDVFQSPEAEFLENLPALRELFGSLHAPGGVYVVEGDTDSPDRLSRITEGTDVEFLDHEVARTELDGMAIAVGGIPVTWSSQQSQATIDDLVATDGVDMRILLTHRPDAVYDVPDGAVDLVVAGHTHGGQVQVPLFGPLMTLTAVPRSVAAGGLHTVAGTSIYLSNGVGVERHQAPQVRIFDRPSVGVVTLT
jgi:predicted MPP superfamily phosphohydrolase